MCDAAFMKKVTSNDQTTCNLLGCGCFGNRWYKLFCISLVLRSVLGPSLLREEWRRKKSKAKSRGVTDCRAHNQMGTRDWVVSAATDLYFTCYPGICHTYTWSEQNKRGGGRCEKVCARSQRSNGVIGLVIDAYKDDKRWRGLALGQKQQLQLGLI